MELIKKSDITCCLDDDTCYFNDNFARVAEGNDVLLYTCNGVSSNIVEYDILPRQKGKIIDVLVKEESAWSRAELWKKTTSSVYEIFNAIYEDELMWYYKEYNIKSERDSYKEMTVRGYSQGDEVTVLVHEDIEVSNEILTNLIYDNPIVARMDYCNYDFYSSFDSEYATFDRSVFIDEAVKYYRVRVPDFDEEIFRQQLLDLVPEYLEYL